jgi:hypothetical protein
MPTTTHMCMYMVPSIRLNIEDLMCHLKEQPINVLPYVEASF